MSVSKGHDFIGMPTIRSAVLYLNLELPDFALKKRFEALSSNPSTPTSPYCMLPMGVAIGRGLKAEIKEKGIDLIVIDPLYKLEDIDECDQAGVKY